MKKNEHYFPTVEFVKDGSFREGWKRRMYEDGQVKRGEGELMPEADDGALDGDEAMEG